MKNLLFFTLLLCSCSTLKHDTKAVNKAALRHPDLVVSTALKLSPTKVGSDTITAYKDTLLIVDCPTFEQDSTTLDAWALQAKDYFTPDTIIRNKVTKVPVKIRLPVQTIIKTIEDTRGKKLLEDANKDLSNKYDQLDDKYENRGKVILWESLALAFIFLYFVFKNKIKGLL